MKHLLHSLLALVTAAAWLLSCDEDCPTCPEPDNGRSQGRAYVAIPSGINGIYVIDLETDAVIDSVKFGDKGGGEVRLTTDNRRLLASSTDDIFRVFDARNMSIVSQGPAFGSFVPVMNDSAILAEYSATLTLLSLPDLDTLLSSAPGVRPISLKYSPHRRIAYTLRGADTLVAVSVDSLVIVDEWIIRYGQESNFYLNSRAFSHDDRFAYFTAYGPTSALFITYDLESRQIVATHPINGPVGRIAVSPDGKEVWVTDPWTIRTS